MDVNESVSGKKGKEMFPQQPDCEKERIPSHSDACLPFLANLLAHGHFW
jgi:hypothetical protein